MYDRCTECSDGLFERGKCRVCHGSGQNVHLNSASAECEHCRGSGVCPKCRGDGLVADPPAGIQTLFDSEEP